MRDSGFPAADHIPRGSAPFSSSERGAEAAFGAAGRSDAENGRNQISRNVAAKRLFCYLYMRNRKTTEMTIEDLALAMTPGLGVKGVKYLLDHFGSAERIFAASETELREGARLRTDAVRNLLDRKGFPAARKEMEHCRRNGLEAIASTDGNYPPLLREINDYPHILYIKGNPGPLAGPCLSMVGTRKMSRYGANVCNMLIRNLAERIPDLVLVSGLAFGIDATCHRLAMEYGLRTVAVVAEALPEITPAQHAHLASEIVETGGAIVSELPSSTKQNGQFYPARNRIIAGLSEGTVLIESPASGGSLITANYADGYDRTVMAVPGRVGDDTSLGSNILLRNLKARMILSAEDIIRELMWDRTKQLRSDHSASIPLTEDERGLLGCFRSGDPLSIAELMELCGLDSGALSALLTGLELSGAVRQLPGNRYEKTIR